MTLSKAERFKLGNKHKRDKRQSVTCFCVWRNGNQKENKAATANGDKIISAARQQQISKGNVAEKDFLTARTQMPRKNKAKSAGKSRKKLVKLNKSVE